MGQPIPLSYLGDGLSKLVKEEMWSKGDVIGYDAVYDHADVLNTNDERRKDSNRGFSPQRHFQHIGAVPCDVWHKHCKKVGYYMMDKEKRKEEIIKFLNQFRGFATVEAIRTHQPNETNILIK